MYNETAESAQWHDRDEWEPDWIKYTFTAWGACTQHSCGQRFAIAGTGGITQEFDERIGETWPEQFDPIACLPMPDIIAIPEGCPSEVSEELRGAFALYWSNRPACAGRIRVSIEHLLDHLNIPLQIATQGGKNRNLKLHDRIKLFEKREPAIGLQLMALKWLGNTGSHDSGVSKDDLLDAFEVLEHALAEIIDPPSQKIAALASELTKRHKPKP